MNDFDLTGKICIVTGGGRGIGLGMAQGLYRHGATVILSGRTKTVLEEAANAMGDRAISIPCDVADEAQVIALRDETLTRFGKIDALVNNAGVDPIFKVAEKTTLEEWRQIIDINLTGTLRACQIFGKTMVNQGFGKILNIASLSTFRGFNQVAAYAASKAGVGSLTKTLAIELAPYKICVNGIAPGVFPTALNAELILHTERGRELKTRTPMRRFGDADELVGGAIYLVSDAASFVTGEILAIDGGFLASGVNQ